MEIPKDFATQEFEKWREAKLHRLEIEAKHFFVAGWAKFAWIAEARRDRMGRELNKLQQRIGRQRKANRKLQEENERLRALVPTSGKEG